MEFTRKQGCPFCGCEDSIFEFNPSAKPWSNGIYISLRCANKNCKATISAWCRDYDFNSGEYVGDTEVGQELMRRWDRRPYQSKDKFDLLYDLAVFSCYLVMEKGASEESIKNAVQKGLTLANGKLEKKKGLRTGQEA